MTYFLQPPPNWTRKFILDNRLKLEMNIPVSNECYKFILTHGELVILVDNETGYFWPWEKVINGDFAVGI